MILRRLFFWILPIMAALTGAQGLAGQPSIDEVRASFSVKDASVIKNESIPNLHKSLGDPKVYALIQAMWHLEEKKYPELSWSLLQEPAVRMKIGAAWAQWVRGKPQGEKEARSVREYAQSYIYDSNEEYRADAVFAVGVAGSRKDLQILVDAIMTEHLRLVTAGAFGMYALIGPDAGPVLTGLASKAKEERTKAVLAQIVSHSSRIRQGSEAK